MQMADDKLGGEDNSWDSFSWNDNILISSLPLLLILPDTQYIYH